MLDWSNLINRKTHVALNDVVKLFTTTEINQNQIYKFDKVNIIEIESVSMSLFIF